MSTTNNGAVGRTLLQKIKSNYFAVRVTLFAVLFLAPNIFFVFWTISPEYQLPYLREFFAAGVALLLSSYIMYYTIKKDDEAAGWFYAFEVFIALCNYWIRLMFDDAGGFEWNWFILPATAFAFMLPWAVKRSAQSIDDEIDLTSVDNLQKNNEILKNENLKLEHDVIGLNQKVNELIDQVQNYHSAVEELNSQVRNEQDRGDHYKNQVDVLRWFLNPAPVMATLENTGGDGSKEPGAKEEGARNGAELSTAADQVPDLKAEAISKEKVVTWKDDDDIFNAGAVKFTQK